MAFNVQLPIPGRTVRIKSLVLLATLLMSPNDLDGKTSNVLVAASPLLRGNAHLARQLADSEEGSEVCNNSSSFLGVGNTACLHENLRTSVFLLSVIVAVSIVVERFIHFIRAVIKCPQLRKIVDRIFEEVMIMGFLSMVIFILNTSGAMRSLALNELTTKEKLHFYEFFHYIVFLTMIYFIAIVLLLLFIGTVVPKIVWEIKYHSDHQRERISNIHDADTYRSPFPSFVGSSIRHSFIRDVSTLGRDTNPYSMGTSIIDDTDTDTLAGEHYVTTQARQCSDGDGLYHSLAVRARALSGMDLVIGSRAYSLLLQQYHRENWCFRFDIRKQYNLWKSFEILAYNICQNRSGYIYKNPNEMERLFGVKPTKAQSSQDTPGAQGENDPNCKNNNNGMTYAKYHVLCMRNLLFHMTNIPPSAFLILVIISMLPTIYPDQDHWIFIGVGGLLLLVNVVIFFKVLKILRGIVDDRLRIISMQDIQARLAKEFESSQSRGQEHHDVPASDSAPVSVEKSIAEDPDRPEKEGQIVLHARHKKASKKFKAAALAVRAIIRMQLSALCHRQLYYHDNRFWFNSPKFLLRVFQFATIGQAFYLVWLSLVEIPSTADTKASNGGGSAFLVLMVFYPALALFVITPLTMPSLVLVMSLTGIFADLNASNGDRAGSHHSVTKEEVKTHTRIMRRSFLKSHYTSGESQLPLPVTPPPYPASPCGSPIKTSNQQDAVASPTNTLFHAYDSPVSSINTRRTDRFFPANNNSVGRNNSFNHSKNQSRPGSIGNTRDDSASSLKRAFDLKAFQSLDGAGPKTTNRINDQTPPQSASSFTSGTSSAHESPRLTGMEMGVPGSKMKRSQANVEPDVQVGNNAAVDTNEQANNLKQVQSPASASFKTYCSKYGGYPDL